MDRLPHQDTIIPREQYLYLYRSSHLFLLSALYALYRNHYIAAPAPGLIFVTSILYWRKPDYSWRLYLDVTTTRTAILYHTIIAYNAEYANMYYMIFSAALLYPLGQHYYNRGEYWNYTYTHMACHILANIGICILYSGYL